jgi:predicted anti-sigma-YlaC factor YlaD
VSGFDCADLDRCLEELIERRLGPERVRAVERHLACCADCAELVRLATQTTAFAQADLVGDVLARTSGRGCRQAARLLCDRRDGALGALDGELLDQHLADCLECRAFDRVLASLEIDLPSLAEIEPDRRFVGDVLRRTSGAPARSVPWIERLRRTWTGLVRRPRFALEAAYVMTGLMLLVVGIPDSPVAGISRRAFAVASERVRPGLETSADEVGTAVGPSVKQSWDTARDKIASGARAAGRGVDDWSGAARDEFENALGTLWGRLASETAEQPPQRSSEASHRDDGDEP